MAQDSGLGEQVYNRLKQAVLVGTLTPQVRLDFADIAEHFGVSTTPVREAAMRLLGEGLLEAHPKGGTRPVLASEYRLRTLLDLHSNLILHAIDWGDPGVAQSPGPEGPTHEAATRRFFRSVAIPTGNPAFVEMVERLADRLAPYRHRELQALPQAAEELQNLQEIAFDPPLLRRGLRSYHRRRSGIVAQIVWLMNSEPDRTS